MSEHDLAELGLGQKLRQLREDRDLELTDVASRVGIAPEQLDAFEAGRAEPAIGELVQLAQALEVSIGHFFQRHLASHRVEVVRSTDRWTVEPHSELGETLSYRYQSLSYNLTDKLMSPFLVEIPPSESTQAAASSHGGEEFLFVLAGQLEVQIGGETHRLEPGDAIYFDSRLDHSLRAVEGTSVRLLACVAEGRAQHKDNPIGRAYG